jgi:hypothetical protein
MGLLRIFSVIGRIVSAIVTGVGISLDYTGKAVLSLTPDDLGLIGLIAFIVFFFLTLYRELELLLQPRPRVQFSGISPERTHLWGKDKFGRAIDIGEGFFIRLAFTNRVSNPSGSDSTAQDMTAHISIINHDKTIDEWDGRWATEEEPKSLGEIWQLNRCNLRANNQQVILDIGYRLKGRAEFQGWDNFHYLQISEPRKRIGCGLYKLKVTIAASNMQRRDFWYTLCIPSVVQDDGTTQVDVKPFKYNVLVETILPILCRLVKAPSNIKTKFRKHRFHRK